MLRAAFVAALLTLVLPATAGAAEGTVSLGLCAPDERAAEFEARMSRVPGAARMTMRFLLEKRRPGSLRYRRVSAPGFSRWTSSRAARYVFTRRIEALEGPARYRAQVRFRWLDADGQVIARDRAWSRSCRQPDHRPNLKLAALQVLGKRYVATVTQHRPQRLRRVPAGADRRRCRQVGGGREPRAGADPRGRAPGRRLRRHGQRVRRPARPRRRALRGRQPAHDHVLNAHLD